MKKIGRIICLLIAMCMMISSCGTVSTSEGKTTELTMYLVGDKPADYDEVLEIINGKLKEDVNAKLNVNFLGWGEWAKKYPLILSGGEGADMVYAAAFMDYQNYAKKGAFLDIKELMKEYAPNAYNALDPKIIDVVTVNGGVYCLPANNVEVNPIGYVVRGDLMDKYNIPEIKSGEDFVHYLEVVKENTDIVPYNASKSDTPVFVSKYTQIGSTNVYYDNTDKENYYKKFYTYEDEEFENYLAHQADVIRQAYLKDLWPKDVIMNQTPSKDAFAAGTSAATIMNLLNFNDLYAKVMATNPEWEPRFYYRGEQEKVPVTVTAGSGIAIVKNSKHPEKCLEVLDLLNTDKEYNRLTTFGIEGKHYVESEAGRFAFPEGVDMTNTGFIPDQAGNWAWRNPEHFMFAETIWPEYETVRDECAEYAIWNPYAAFTFNDESVINEISAVKSIEGENSSLVNWGMVDRKEIRAKELEQLKTAGIDKTIAEAKKQLEEFVKTVE